MRLFRILLAFEDLMVQGLLRSPTFHRGVRTIRRTWEDHRYGRDPNEPLRQGEATADPSKQKTSRFLKYFIEEFRNQIPSALRNSQHRRPGPRKS